MLNPLFPQTKRTSVTSSCYCQQDLIRALLTVVCRKRTTVAHVIGLYYAETFQVRIKAQDQKKAESMACFRILEGL